MTPDYHGEPKRKCPRCGGLGTIPTPDMKHNEICPICGGSGIDQREEPKVKWKQS